MDTFDLPRSTWEQMINEWIFNERDRQILKRRILDGVCFEPLAEEFYLSVQQTKTIVYKSQRILQSHIK
jgi:hypothetical protein